MLKYVLLTAVLSCSVVGCGGVPETKIQVPQNAIVDSVKKTLDDYAKTGQMGSSLTSLISDINGIASTDSAMAAKLRESYAGLQQAKNPAEVKAKAKEMLAILEGN